MYLLTQVMIDMPSLDINKRTLFFGEWGVFAVSWVSDPCATWV